MFPASTGCTLTLCHISRYAGSSFHSRHLYFSWCTLNKIFSRFLSFRPTVASRGEFSGLVTTEFSIHKVRRCPCFKNRCLRCEEGLLTWEFVGVYVWFYCFGKCITIRGCSVLVRFIFFTVPKVVLKRREIVFEVIGFSDRYPSTGNVIKWNKLRTILSHFLTSRTKDRINNKLSFM